MKRLTIAVVFLALAAGGGGVRAQPSSHGDTNSDPLLDASTCLLVDSDSNFDDLRAIAVLALNRRIVAIIATAGILPETEGAQTLAQFAAAAPGPVRIITGLARTGKTPPTQLGWRLDEVRGDARKLKDELGAQNIHPLPVESPRNVEELQKAVRNAINGCPSVGLLIIGPWSSFVEYHNVVADSLAFVVAQGQSQTENRVGANCGFDKDACAKAEKMIANSRHYWVNIAHNTPKDDYMRDRLGAAPLAAALGHIMDMEKAFEKHPSWGTLYPWDDMAALFILRPDAFKLIAQHYEPAHAPDTMHDLERAAMDGDPDHVPGRDVARQ